MNRIEFQQLADIRLRESGVLLSQGCFDGAYYLAGYAVECALKACIAKLTQAHDFPNRDFARDCFTHSIAKLVTLVGLETARSIEAQTRAAFSANWNLVVDWDEASRYRRVSQAQAQQLYDAITDANDGILTWVKLHW